MYLFKMEKDKNDKANNKFLAKISSFVKTNG